MPPELFQIYRPGVDIGVAQDQLVTPKMDTWAMTISIFEHFGLLDLNRYKDAFQHNPQQYYGSIIAHMTRILPTSVAPYNSDILLKGIAPLKSDRYSPVEMARYVKADIARISSTR